MRPHPLAPALRPTQIVCAVALVCGAAQGQSLEREGLQLAALVPPSAVSSVSSSPATPRMQRQAPADFRPSTTLVDRVLVWRGERRASIVFVAQPGSTSSTPSSAASNYALVPTSVREFRSFLLGLGFERGPVEAYLRRPAYSPGERVCLPIEASPEVCIDVSLSVETSGEIAFLAADADRKLVESAQEGRSEVAAAGSAQLSLGATQNSSAGGSAASDSRNLGFSARGVLSRGDARLEYDVAGFSTQQSGEQASAFNAFNPLNPLQARQPDTTARINLLAAGKRLGQDLGTVYGGLFQSGAGDGLGAGGNLFFTRPTLVGFAYKSDGGELSSFGSSQRVRVLLLTPSLVRIRSQSAQVFEGQLPAGERVISFAGYGEPFVEVLVRDASGRESAQRTEVLPGETQEAPTFSAQRNPHGFYVDIGRPVSQNVFRPDLHAPINPLNPTQRPLAFRRIEVEDATVASLGYSYASELGFMRAGVQSANGLVRTGLALSDRLLTRQASVMLGGEGERGASASFSPVLAIGLQPSASMTYYRPPRDTAECGSIYESFSCYGGQPYRSWSLGIGWRDFPVSLNYSQARSGATEIERATLQGSFGLPMAGLRTSVLTLLSYEPATKNKSMLVSLVVPLDSIGAMLTGSASSNFDGNTLLSAGYSRPFTAPEYEHLRSVSLSASRSDSGGDSGANTAATGYLTSQLGPVGNTASLSRSARSTSVQTTFSMDYAVTPAGAAFTREESGRMGGGGLFDAGGQAGVSILNRSQDPQTALVSGRSVEVPAGASVYVPVGTGYLRGVTVSPGPALNEEDSRAGQFLHKGNVKSVVIADGFWVTARFMRSDGQPLAAQFTYKRPGERLERLYMDRQQQAMLYEVRDEGALIERLVTAEGETGEYRCTVPADQAPQPGDVSTYKRLSYQCAVLPGPGRSIVQDTSPAPAAPGRPGVPGMRAAMAAESVQSTAVAALAVAPAPAPAPAPAMIQLSDADSLLLRLDRRVSTTTTASTSPVTPAPSRTNNNFVASYDDQLKLGR